MSRLTGYCEDWSCPAAVSCKWAWGRSAVYAAMSEEPGRTPLWKGPREQGAESCDRYQRDRVRKWLIPSFAGRAALASHRQENEHG